MTKIKGHLSKNTNRQATRINARLFLSSNVELVDRTNVKRVNPSLILDKILDNLNKAVHHLILARRYPLAAADGMDYEGLVNLDKSTTPISFNGKVYVGGNYLPASYSKDNKSKLEHKLALATFLQNQERLRKEDEIKLTVELLNNPYNPIGWIPGLRSVVNTGADLNYSRTHNTTFTPYTADAAFSTAGDAITLGFGLGPFLNYAGSYAGTVAGGLIGELFDNPLLGLLIGGTTGGFSPLIYNTSKEFLSNKVGPYLLARTMNSSLKSALVSPELHPIRTDFNFGKGSGRVLRADKGDARGLFTGLGAYTQNGFLYPGKTRMEGLRDFTWWNEDELFSTGFNKKPHLRVFIANKSDIPGLLRVREMNEAVGQWRPGRKSFVRKSEMVTAEPIDLSNLTLYNYDPNLGIYVRSDVQTHNLSPSLPNPLNTPKTNYSLYERPSKLTSAERAGIPRGERNNISSPVNPDEEFKLMYGYSRPSARSHLLVSTLLPNELPKFSEVTNPKYSFKYYVSPDGSMNFLDPGSQYITNLKEYIATLPKSEMINLSIITDYRNYLSRIGENPYILTDLQISDLITSLYNTLSSEMSGKLKGVPLFHGSAVPVEQFNFQANTGKGIFNMGAAGPGNYFSTGRHNYHIPFIYDEATRGFKLLGDMQPYLINNVLSTPISHTLLRKGILPNYLEPPIGWVKTLRSQQRLLRNGADLSEEEIKLLENSIKEYLNSAEYLEYIKLNIEPYLKDRDMFIIDNDAIGLDLPLGRTFMPSLNGTKIQSIEGVIPRNTGIKSLFPHPSTLIKDSDGNWIIKRNWLDTRVNYKNGGKLNRRQR